MPRAIQFVPALQVGHGPVKHQSEDLIGIPPLVHQQLRQELDQRFPFVLEVSVGVVDFQAGQFGSVPHARFLGMGVEEHAAVRHRRLGDLGAVPAVVEHDVRRDAEGHEALLHLKSRDKELALVQPAPLAAEVGFPCVAVIAQADEVGVGLLQCLEDLGERDFAIVGEFRMTVQHAAVLPPIGQGGGGRRAWRARRSGRPPLRGNGPMNDKGRCGARTG